VNDAGDASRSRLANAKFVPPPVPRCYVARPRLHEALERGAGVPATIVVGPPGSGKTVAVASWLATRSDDAAMWMSCDGRDTDPATFWRDMTEGFRRLWPDHWLEVRDLLDEDRPSLGDVAVATANELDELGEPVTIVLDDFHVAKEANPSVAVALEALPPPVRFLFVSRADPELPLHRMRVQHELLELRDQDLRLSSDETAALAAALGLVLDREASRLLYERTHGWMAAVHLAAISLRDRTDAQAFLQEFSGENRLMAEFLLGEVLNRQPLHIQRFLEDSSVLEDLDFAACRAVTGVAESAELIRDLSAENTLIMSRGDGYSYYYHQLFRDLLQYRLRTNSPERYAVLHEVAAKWYTADGEFDRAVGHLTAAGNSQAAYALLRDRAYDMFLHGGPSAFDRVISVVDLQGAVDDPGRAVDVAVSLAVAGATDAAERWIARVDQSAGALSMRDVARLACVRGVVALLRGDASASEAALLEAFATGVQDPVVAGTVQLAMFARLWLDDPAGARLLHDSAVKRADLELVVEEVTLKAPLAWTASVEGRLREAEQVALEALDRAKHYDVLEHPMTFGALIARGLVLYEWDRFLESEQVIEEAIRLSEGIRPPWVLLGRVALARLYIAERRFVEAVSALEYARAALPASTSSPLCDLVTACEVRLALTTDDTTRAEALVPTMRPSQRRERVEAAVALARGHADAALSRLESLRPATLRQRLDTAVLRTRALHALGHAEASVALGETISLARDEGFVIALVDGLPELGSRVSYHMRSGPIGAFEQSVLDRLDRPRVAPIGVGNADLVVPLTDREQTILRYLSSRLTLKEIASECYVSPNTVKTQSQAIYRKLGVSTRNEAIIEGRRLRLI